MPVGIKQELWISDLIKKELDYGGKIIYPEHHESHAANSALNEIAKLLSGNPNLKVFIVGHTDNAGGVDYE